MLIKLSTGKLFCPTTATTIAQQDIKEYLIKIINALPIAGMFVFEWKINHRVLFTPFSMF